jgi:acyl-CoA thioesterase FadM
MNLFLRLLFTILQSMKMPAFTDMTQPTRIRLRVYHTDLDSNGHMNNGRYLTLMDLGRMNLIMRSGLLQYALKNKLAPNLAAAQMRFRIQMVAWQPFDLETRVVCWDEKWIYIEQRFYFVKGPKAGAVAAIGLVKGGFYDRRIKTTLPTSELFKAAGFEQASPEFPDYIKKWIEAEEELKLLTARNDHNT